MTPGIGLGARPYTCGVETTALHPPIRVRCTPQDPGSARRLSAALRDMVRRAGRSPLVVVCIGTDRSTGDALGPLTGCELVSRGYPAELVFGTLDDPVHAGNLCEALVRVDLAYPGATVLAVDACLGSPENVGSISLTDGPVRPGAGVNKTLPPVGQLSVTGVVNVAGFMEYFVLQNTRLSLVVRMARAIAQAIVDAIGHRSDIWDAHAAHSGGSTAESQLREPAACCGEVALTDSRST